MKSFSLRSHFQTHIPVLDPTPLQLKIPMAVPHHQPPQPSVWTVLLRPFLRQGTPTPQTTNVDERKILQVPKHETPELQEAPPQAILRVPISTHPDDGFLSGAWLFDLCVAPTWLVIELKRKPGPMQVPLQGHAHAFAQDERGIEAEMWAFYFGGFPKWFQRALRVTKPDMGKKKQPRLQPVFSRGG